MHHDPGTSPSPATSPSLPAELALAHARIRSLEAELVRTRAEFSGLSHRLAHDVQAVLARAGTFAGYVGEAAAARLEPRELDYLRRIAAASAQGASAAVDLASLANVLAAEMAPARVDPAAVVAQCVRDLDGSARERGIRFVLPGGPVPHAHADPALVRLALWHLLANSVKFTRPCPQPRVEVEVQELAERCRIVVRDNGVGFSRAYAHKLFQPFERLHHGAEFEGNGVGLAIVREVAHRHGGRAGAESPEGGGARFWIDLPLAPRAPHAPQPARAPGRPRRLIVLVDDEPLVLMTLRTLLERDGDEVFAAAGGEAGLDLLRALAARQRTVDVVVSDWTMPGVPGARVVEAARALHPGARVVVLTGARTGASPGSSIHAAADEVVAKPLRGAALRRALAPSTP